MAEGARPASATPRPSRRFARASAVAAVALAAAFVTWLVLGRDDDGSTNSASTPPPTLVGTTPRVTLTRPAIASVAQLRAAAAATSVPIYWVGRRAGNRIELTRAPGGTVFVRYLPPDVRAGSTRTFLTVATYPRPAGFDEVRTFAKQPGARTIRLAGGGLAVSTRGAPRNVHIGYPDQPYQVEVFAPGAGLVEQLASSGAVRPVS